MFDVGGARRCWAEKFQDRGDLSTFSLHKNANFFLPFFLSAKKKRKVEIRISQFQHMVLKFSQPSKSQARELWRKRHAQQHPVCSFPQGKPSGFEYQQATSTDENEGKKESFCLSNLYLCAHSVKFILYLDYWGLIMSSYSNREDCPFLCVVVLLKKPSPFLLSNI